MSSLFLQHVILLLTSTSHNLQEKNDTMTSTIRYFLQQRKVNALENEKVKTALHSFHVSIQAVMRALSERGVSDDGILEFECLLEKGLNKKAMDLATRYQDAAFDEDLELVQLLVYAWRALCCYHEGLHRRAFNECIPREDAPRVKKCKRDQRDDLGEQTIACLIELYKMDREQKRLERNQEWKRRQHEEREQMSSREESIEECGGDERDDVEPAEEVILFRRVNSARSSLMSRFEPNT